ncbi:MAG: hypothetical protein GY824_07225, partial [Delftia sp.]|nr:hypothetical protein [Delftia sp.]
RAAKLAALPEGTINQHATVAFSIEIGGPDGLHLLDVENLREANGSVAYSTAATAFFARYVRHRDPAALRYLRQVAVNGAVPYVAPIDIFEQAWALWNLALTGPLDDDVLALCQPHLDFMQAEWRPGRGAAIMVVSASAGATVPRRFCMRAAPAHCHKRAALEDARICEW